MNHLAGTGGAARAAPVTAAVLAGVSLWAAHPPLGFGLLAFFVVPGVLAAVWLASRRGGPPRRVAWLGMVAGLVGYLPMLTWLVPPAGPVAWLLLSVVQALYVAAFAVLVRPWIRHPALAVVAPVLWTGLDAWRALVPLSGFGWGALAYAHVDGEWLLPLARIGGQHLITFATVLVGTLAFDALRRGMEAIRSLDGPRLERAPAGLPAARPALIGLAVSVVAVTLVTVDPPPPSGELDVLVAQGNDLVESRFPSAEEDRLITSNLATLTLESAERDGAPELTIWPESSVDRDPFAGGGGDLLPLVERAAEVGGDLLAGINLRGPRPATFLNAAVLLDDDADPVDRYVKRTLVPFGEFVPWRSVLGDLPPLRRIPRDGVPGEGPHAVSLGGTVDVAVAICFESLFPELVRENVLAGGVAEIVVITTNDASFGVSAEPAQHLAQARLRAVETGRWVVYGALSGRSAFVDPSAEVHDLTELFTLDTIRRRVPLVEGKTAFLTVGDLVGKGARVLVLAAVLWLIVSRVRHRRRIRPPETP